MSNGESRFWYKSIFVPTHLKRMIFFLTLDILFIIISLYLAFSLRFDFNIPDYYYSAFIRSLPLFIVIKIICFYVFKLYNITWKYVSIDDLINTIKGVVISEAIVMFSILNLLSFHIITFKWYPRSIFIIDGLLSFIFLSGIRISKRIFLEILKRKSIKNGHNTIIIGAGNTGEMILRDIIRQKYKNFYPVCILDDDKNKIGNYIHNVLVSGPISLLPDYISRYNIEAIIIAIPELDYKSVKKIYKIAKEKGVKNIKIVPKIYSYNKPSISVMSLEDIKIEDLIGRSAIQIDFTAIENFLKDKIVMITGAAGSIGSEISHQICHFNPKRVILFDWDETSLFMLERKLARRFPRLRETGCLYPVIGDIRDKEKIFQVMGEHLPQVLFHAAAYKHVPMMELYPIEAIKTNVLGTKNIVTGAAFYGVEKFIFISTDKAVNPKSIMGATKRLGELICQAYNGTKGCDFISVRFGNVFGSRGSVLPIWLEQLRQGGPLTVTHRGMKRYFMTIPEAVSLVLQASAFGHGGEIFVLDMGQEVSIVKLAEELIKFHGLTPYKDINIVFTGLRPGEKLREELFTEQEKICSTKHENIYLTKGNTAYSAEQIEELIRGFKELIYNRRDYKTMILDLKKLIKKYIPNYHL